MICTSLLLLPGPLLTQHLIDETLPQKDLVELSLFLLVISLLVLIHSEAERRQTLLTTEINETIFLSLKRGILRRLTFGRFEKIQEMGPQYLASRVNQDVEQVSVFFADTFFRVLKDIITSLVGIAALVHLNLYMTVLVLLFIPLYVKVGNVLSKGTEDLAEDYLEKSAQARTTLDLAIKNIPIWQIFKKGFGIDKFSRIGAERKNSVIRYQELQSRHELILGMMDSLFPVLLIGFGIYEIIQGRFTLGALLAFNQFVSYIFSPTIQLTRLHLEIKKGFVAMDRMSTLLDLGRDELPAPLKVDASTLSLQNVNFSFHDKPALHDMSIDLKKGSICAIVGASGAGKSTLLKVLAGLYQAKGTISFQNSTYKLEDSPLLGVAALVSEEVNVFDGSILENIYLEQDERDQQKVPLSNLLSFIKALGENAEQLSQGQKQRISLARTLVSGFPVLLFDEPTSNLDAFNESLFHDELDRLKQDHIVAISTHRLNTVNRCDHIIMLSKGRVIATGSLSSLLSSSPEFKELYDSFFAEDDVRSATKAKGLGTV